MAVSRYYSSVARRTTLTADISSSATSITVAAATGFPSLYPFTLIIDQDTVDEEIVTVTNRSGTSLTVTRGSDGTAAVAHTAGAQVEHGVSARDFTESRQHEDSSEAVHGLGSGSAVVGTTTSQTLSNKTLGSDLAAGGFKVTGLADPTSAQDAATKNWTETGLTSQLVLATTAKTGAETAQSAAEAAQAAAELAETNSETAQAAAEAAQGSAETAQSAAEVAQGASETAQVAAEAAQAGAETAETGAASSAAAASSSASSAASSSSSASASQTAAASSASSASSSASSATSSASSAAASASAAATSETNAAASEVAAGSSETNAAASEAASAASEVASAASESAAAASETNAAASEAAAASSESAASSSASASASSASASAASASSAASSAAAAATALDSFDDRYLGAKATAPTVDNDGDPLVQGALFYLNTGTAEQIGMYVYDGGSWLKASAASVASIVTYEYVATASQTVFTGSDANGVSLSFTSGLIQVFLNGVLLSPGDDYTTSTNTVTLASGAAASDVLVVVAFASFNVANTYTVAEADAAIASATAGLGGATGGGSDQVFYENDQTVTTSYTITTAKNAITAGPVTIDSGVTVTVPSGSYWSVV